MKYIEGTKPEVIAIGKHIESVLKSHDISDIYKWLAVDDDATSVWLFTERPILRGDLGVWDFRTGGIRSFQIAFNANEVRMISDNVQDMLFTLGSEERCL